MEALNDGTYVYRKKLSSESTSLPNRPHNMKRYQPDIQFHHPSHHDGNYSLPTAADSRDVTDPKLLKLILEQMKAKKEEKRKRMKPTQEEEHKHVHRQSSVKGNETSNVKMAAEALSPDTNTSSTEGANATQTSSEELFKDVARRFEALGTRHHKVLEKLNSHFKAPEFPDSKIDELRREKRDVLLAALGRSLNEDDELRDSALEEVSTNLRYCSIFLFSWFTRL